MARTYRFVVGPADAELRLDQYLVRHLPQSLSRAAIQRAIAQGGVSLDDRPAAKPNRRLKPGQRVEARLEQLPQPSRGVTLVPEPIPLAIVHEDAQLLVVNKPPGLVVHPAPGHWSGTLVNAVLWHLNQGQGAGDGGQSSVSSKFEVRSSKRSPSIARDPSNFELRTSSCSSEAGALPRAGIVHRLDKDTSGLLVIAKTELALRLLARQLKAREISRRYLALVSGHLPFDEGTVDAAIGRHQKDRKLMAIRHLGGREAVTHYRVLARLSSESLGAGDAGRGSVSSKFEVRSSKRSPSIARDPSNFELRTSNELFPASLRYSLLEVALETGRTHQIRVHFAHLGHPVLGDPVYSGHSAVHWERLGIRRQLLHAYALRLSHPATRQPLDLRATLPEDFNRWVPEELSRTFR